MEKHHLEEDQEDREDSSKRIRVTSLSFFGFFFRFTLPINQQKNNPSESKNNETNLLNLFKLKFASKKLQINFVYDKLLTFYKNNHFYRIIRPLLFNNILKMRNISLKLINLL